ncbi:MAG: bacillithiol transferase BstA [Gemmatimonadaceae bacterium]
MLFRASGGCASRSEGALPGLDSMMDRSQFTAMPVDDLRYPIGKFASPPLPLSASERATLIDEIAGLPTALRGAVRGLTEAQLETPYRPGGWSVRQLAHHVPDSHVNAYVRCKLALTEEMPTIKPYDEARWANLDDTRTTPIEVSLTLLDALHARWVILLRSLSPRDFARTLTHPETGSATVDRLVALYAWHGKHHVAHVTALRHREGWR